MAHTGIPMQLQALDIRCDPHVAMAEGSGLILLKASVHFVRCSVLKILLRCSKILAAEVRVGGPLVSLKGAIAVILITPDRCCYGETQEKREGKWQEC